MRILPITAAAGIAALVLTMAAIPPAGATGPNSRDIAAGQRARAQVESRACFDNLQGRHGASIESQSSDSGDGAFDSTAAQTFTIASPCRVTQIDVAGRYSGGTGEATSETVIFYSTEKGALRKPIHKETVTGIDTAGSFSIPLDAFTLRKGTYAVAVTANMEGSGVWSWDTKPTKTKGLTNAVWQNPGDGYGTGCTGWTKLPDCPRMPLHGKAIGDIHDWNLTFELPEEHGCNVTVGLVEAKGCYVKTRFGFGPRYFFDGDVLVNGVTYSPLDPNQKLVLNAATQTFSGDAAVSIADGSNTVSLYQGSFSNAYASGQYSIPMSSSVTNILGMDSTDTALNFSVPVVGESDAHFIFSPPNPFHSVNLTGLLTTDNTGKITVNATVYALTLPLSGTTVTSLKFSTTDTAPAKRAHPNYPTPWTVTFDAALPGADHSISLSGTANYNGPGSWTWNAFSANYDGDIQINGAHITHLDVNVTLSPFAMGGNVTLWLGPMIGQDHAADITGGFLYDSVTHRFTASGTLKTVNQPSMSATLTVEPGHVGVGGTIQYHKGCADLTGAVNGDFYSNGFNIAGSVTLSGGCFINSHSVSAVLSSNGVGACFHHSKPLFAYDAGIGYHWGASSPQIFSTNCNLASYSFPKRFQALQPGDESTVTLPAGLDETVFAITGQDGMPDVVVTGPGGETVETNQAYEAEDGHYMVAFDPDRQTAYVMVAEPTAGLWTLTPQPGSPVVTDVGHAESLPAPEVSAAVTKGSGTKEILSWNLTARPGQTVQFVEQGASTYEELTTTGASTGQIEFTPADGQAESRTITAVVLYDGLQWTTIDLASYDAPAMATIRASVDDQGGTGTVASDDGAIVCDTDGSNCSESMPQGAVVTLTASADAGSKFLGWDGVCGGEGTCTITMDHANAATAVFVVDTPAVTPTMIQPVKFQRSTTFAVSWKTSDSTVATYDVRVRTQSASDDSFTDVVDWLDDTTFSNATYVGAPGYTYCFAVRETNTAGNTSGWSQESCGTTPIDDTSLSMTKGNWEDRTDPNYYLQTASAGTGKSASLELAGLYAKQLAIMVLKSPGLGTIQIYWNGKLLKTASLAGPTRYRNLIALRPFTTQQKGILKIVSKTPDRDIVIDGVTVVPQLADHKAIR